MTFIENPTGESIELSQDDIPYLLSQYPCKATYNNIILNSLKSKHNNISYCIRSGEKDQQNFKDERNIVEIVCNGLLPSLYIQIPDDYKEEVFPEDFVLVKHEDSIEIAQVKLIGEIVHLKRCSLMNLSENLPMLIRRATNEDFDRIRKNLEDEQRAISIFKNNIKKYVLEMKLVSIHYQFDRKKLFFFYTAEGRVDFRELAKGLAAEFKTRIELRQIGVRDEAKKIGGAGSCGREFCCLSFLNNFKRISTQLANEQNLFSSMGKLSGPCGKLKCCLSFEVE